MSRVILSERARSDLARLYEFLAKHDTHIADNAIDTIINALTLLEQMPLAASLVTGRKDIRKLVIQFGESGYLAFYEYKHVTDTVLIATVMHQRERYFFEDVGKKDESRAHALSILKNAPDVSPTDDV
ncbi:MAG: type II toxin-antitoxin system RelE/ParE family toxin [Formosimonas sp.]